MAILTKIIEQIKISHQKEFADFDTYVANNSLHKKRIPLNVLKDIANNFFLICETKQASPSKGVICKNYDPLAIAKNYQKAGANAISVITEKHFFKGDIEHLKIIRDKIDLPLLRKDFIIHKQQIWQSYQYGADIVLLIASCLSQTELLEFKNYIESFGMTALIEVHDSEDLEKSLKVNPKLIGINNRNLKTFTVDLKHCLMLRKKIPADLPTIAESGICTSTDISILKKNDFQGALVGESLLKQKDIFKAVTKLMNP